MKRASKYSWISSRSCIEAATSATASDLSSTSALMATRARSTPFVTYLYRYLMALIDEQISTLMCALYLRSSQALYGTTQLLSICDASTATA